MTNWNPTTDHEKALKAALEKLTASTDGVILTPLKQQAKDAEQKRFILQAHSYFALRAYVITGKTFPATDAQFDGQISKDCFRRLDQVDSKIYEETKSGVVAVGSTCNKFYDDDFYNIVNAGTITVTWSENTLTLLKHGARLNLFDHLMVLVDSKYQTQSDRDQAWISAYNAATFVLTRLIKEADNGRAEAEKIRNALLKFRDTTRDDVLSKVTTLVQKYTKGPVNNPKVGNKTYLNYLNEDLAKNIKETAAILDRYNQKYNDWKSTTGIAIGVGVAIGWIPVFGWVPVGFMAAEAIELRKAWDTLLGSYNEMKKHNEEETKLIEFVSKLVKQFDGLLDKIDAAIDAIGELSKLFQQQSEAYKIISDNLSNIKDSTTVNDAFIRKDYMEDSIERTVAKIQQLQKAAAGFIDAILTEDKDVLGKPST